MKNRIQIKLAGLSAKRAIYGVCTLSMFMNLQVASAAAAVGKENATPALEKNAQTISEATIAVHETELALAALQKGHKKDALSAIERAMGKLEIILARDSSVALAPAGVSVVTNAVVADAEAVRNVREQAQKFLNDGHVQEARHLLDQLSSETVVSVTNIPLATYPAAMKEAVRLIDRNEITEAERTLKVAMSTLVVSDTIIPLPLVHARQNLSGAETLLQLKVRTEPDVSKLNVLLKNARTDLEFAKQLGYGVDSALPELFAKLDELEGKTNHDESRVGVLAKIRSKLTRFLNFKHGELPQQNSPRVEEG